MLSSNNMLPMGETTNAILGSSKVLTFHTGNPESQSVNNIESAILKNLACDLDDSTEFPSEHISSVEQTNDLFNHHILTVCQSSQSNVAMSVELNKDIPPIYTNSKYDEKINPTANLAEQNLTNTVTLGPDATSLYNSNVKFEYSDGDKQYTSTDGHYLVFDTTDDDYNLHKSINSRMSNTAQNAEEGLVVGFDSNFNKTNAFLTHNILQRNQDNSIAPSGLSLSGDGIGISDGLSSSSNWNSLSVNVLNSEVLNSEVNTPLFGALKFVNENAKIDFPVNSNNINENSTLSKLSNGSSVATILDQTLTEYEFKDYFTSEQLEKVGPGYDFSLTIHSNETDGYTLESTTNAMNVPVYDTDNETTGYTKLPMFKLNDDEIEENCLYMNNMKTLNLFNNDSHKLFVSNGSLEKNITSSSNRNFDYFDILDGVEKLIASDNNDIGDLTKSGLIKVHDTSNELDSDFCRFTKFTDDSFLVPTTESSNISRLVVTYDESEGDYNADTGVLSQVFKDNFYVQSKLTTLNHSTSSTFSYDKWSPDIYTNLNAARAHDTVLCFQNEQDNVNNFSSNNISEFEAAGLNNLVNPGQSVFLTLHKTFNFEDSDESPLFKTVDNNQKQGVVSNVSITDMSLKQIKSHDIRVVFKCKKVSDMPLSTNSLWSWVTGDDQTGNFANFDDSLNDGYLISCKDNNDFLGYHMYDIINGNPSNDINVEFKLNTDAESRPTKDYLSRHAVVSIRYNNATIDKVIDQDDTDFKIVHESETTSTGEDQDLTDLSLPFNYIVKKYVTTKMFRVAIRNRVGPYNNLWIQSPPVEEKTYWYQLTNSNKNNQVMPDHYLMKIVNPEGQQIFMAKRTFKVQEGSPVSSISTDVNFKVKDLMGLTANVEYLDSQSQSWQKFMLKPDPIYNHSVDPMYDSSALLTIMDPNNIILELGKVYISLDAELHTKLGSCNDVSMVDNTDNAMYMINLSMPRGNNSFQVKGYVYDNAMDSKHFNNTTNWSPYSDGDAVFLRNSDGVLKGTPIQYLNTFVNLIDPTPGDTANVNETNKIQVTVRQGSQSLLSFISDKYILENFNVINSKHTIVQHDYYAGKISYNDNEPVLRGTEYLSSNNSVSDYVNLKFGISTSVGIRAELTSLGTDDANTRLRKSNFRLNSDRVQMSPITEPVNVDNKYNGIYSNTSEYIQPSESGVPLPTNSTKHRNIKVNIFRGLHNGELPIDIVRTMTKVKFVIGDKFVDDLNVVSNTNIASVWSNRNKFNGQDAILRSKQLIKGNFTTDELENMSIGGLAQGENIGSLGLAFDCEYSMFPRPISSLHKIGIHLSPSTYTKTIVNPLDSSLDETVNENLFKYKLHSFKNFSLVASRIKVYRDESYKFNYTIPDLKVYHTQSFIGDPRALSSESWSLKHTYSDNVLRDGVIIGVLLFKKLQTFSSSFTKYCILSRPSAYLESYDVAQVTESLPDDYATKLYTPKRLYFDIIIDKPNGEQGEIPQNQTHKPFNKLPAINVPNAYNAIPASYGLNNVRVGLNVANYLHFRERELPKNSFTMSSNKLTMSMGVGLTAYVGHNYTVIFNDYIEHLNNPDSWHLELRNDLSNNFGLDKKWNLSFGVLKEPVKAFLALSLNPLNDNSIDINGITSYGLGTYTLDLKLLDSLKMKYYDVKQVYDYINDTHKAVFTRYSTADSTPLNWIDNNDFSKSSLFHPWMVTKETCEIDLKILNNLSSVPFKVDALIKEYIKSVDFSELTWANDTNFTSRKSHIMLNALSDVGAGGLLKFLQVTNDHPFKLLIHRRPNILTVKRSDGSTILSISHDGIVSSTSLCSSKLSLNPIVSNVSYSPEYLDAALWYSHHINPIDDN